MRSYRLQKTPRRGRMNSTTSSTHLSKANLDKRRENCLRTARQLTGRIFVTLETRTALCVTLRTNKSVFVDGLLRRAGLDSWDRTRLTLDRQETKAMLMLMQWRRIISGNLRRRTSRWDKKEFTILPARISGLQILLECNGDSGARSATSEPDLG